jgi:ABC-type transport system involved in cytochrome bd biosynthesis fused ATPase/permease subunit
MATTVKQLIDTVNDNLTNVTVLQSQIKDALESMNQTTPLTQDNVYVQSQIQKLKDEETNYDTQFEEEESKLQAMGGKTRKQTLQEFVLFFFYLAFGVFIVSVAVYVQITEKNGSKTAKVAFALLFILFIITGVLIRYA